MFEGLIAGALILSGAVTLILWVEGRAALGARSLVALGYLIVLTSSGLAVGLRLTGLDFAMGSIPAVLLALAAWALVIGLTARPAVEPPDRPVR